MTNQEKYKTAKEKEAAHKREVDALAAKLDEARHCWKVWSDRADELLTMCNEQYAKLKTVGDAAKLREALEYVIHFDATDEAAMEDGLTDAERIAEYADHIKECQKKAVAALAAPPRNCNVGTADEQYERWRVFCSRYDHVCTGCPFDGYDRSLAYCFAGWAQMPYEEGGNK